jgi:hypothetical protein
VDGWRAGGRDDRPIAPIGGDPIGTERPRHDRCALTWSTWGSCRGSGQARYAAQQDRPAGWRRSNSTSRVPLRRARTSRNSDGCLSHPEISRWEQPAGHGRWRHLTCTSMRSRRWTHGRLDMLRDLPRRVICRLVSMPLDMCRLELLLRGILRPGFPAPGYRAPGYAASRCPPPQRYG